ncbi:AEC family transporter [Acinetobacter puyangensis]|uniref:Transporter n=1 Tax=Acinetobacter puyangensis TaxID=1096779 RepID=A0A240E9V4_9GAMM|nr:AEC family transporter [Acinetobacter puyangensis]SNX44690.1 hypothetical protein SAMN05421731_10441 [Acinetobacter puyangensis]
MVLTVILPIILLSVLGYLSVAFKLIMPVQIQALSAFVIKIALPAFLIYALSSKNIHELWHPSYVIAYAVGSLIIFASAYLLFWRYFHFNLTQSAIMSMGASMSNTGFIGTAILTMLIGSHAAVYISLTLIIENLVILMLVLIIAEMGQQQGQFLSVLKLTLKNISKNLLIAAIFIGLFLSVSDLHLPTQVQYALEMLGKTAAPLALFAIGGSLYGIGLRTIQFNGVVLVLFKVLLMPLVIFLLFLMLPNVSQEMLYAGTLIAALPMPIAFGIFGQMYGLNERALAPLMLSTFLGMLGVSSLIYLWY